MLRNAALATILLALVATVSNAGDLLPIVFEDSNITMGGRAVKCDLYYILLGDNGSLNQGDVIQIMQQHSDREHYGVLHGRFAASDDLREVVIRWQPIGDEKVGQTEGARLTIVDGTANRLKYEIYAHDDKSQVGDVLRARLAKFDHLPAWVRSAATPSIIAKLPIDQQVLYHKMQAQQLKTFSEITKIWMDALD